MQEAIDLFPIPHTASSAIRTCPTRGHGERYRVKETPLFQGCFTADQPCKYKDYYIYIYISTYLLQLSISWQKYLFIHE